MEQQYDDTFLARWLANELTAEELREFESSEDFAKYAQIVDTLERAEVPEFEVEANLQATLDKLKVEEIDSTSKKKVITLWSYAVAASVIILFTVYNFFLSGSETTYSTQFAEKTQFELPDGSQVDLNADSEVTFNTSDWSDNRALNLNGEAFFKVKKGSKFTVNTNQGNVSVLGTQFTVNARENLYHVICYEGKVLVVTQQKDSITLTKGMAFLLNQGEPKEYTLESQAPHWINNESSYKEMPINVVLDELERQFGITISGKENLKPALFTGRFSHEDATLAVQTVFMAMEIPYTTDAQGNVLIQK